MTKNNSFKDALMEAQTNIEKNLYNAVAGNLSLLAGRSTKLFDFSNKNLEALSKGYAWDSLSTFAVYNLLAAIECVKNDYVRTGVAFGVPCLVEVLQKFDLISGKYDPKDFIAYGVGAGLALGIDKAVKYFSKEKSLKEISSL